MKAALVGIVILALYVPAALGQTPDPSSSPVSSSQEKIAQKSSTNTVASSSPTAVKVGKAALLLPPEKSNPVKL